MHARKLIEEILEISLVIYDNTMFSVKQYV